MSDENPPPAPKKQAICWDFYMALSPDLDLKDCRARNLEKIKKKDIKTAERALTWKELDQRSFSSRSEAALALVRAIALMDSTDRNPASIFAVKSYLLMGRASLYLAQEAHYEYNLDKAPTGREELEKRLENASLAKAMQACIFMAGEDPLNISLTMSRFAWLTVGQVANDRGSNSRPGMAEGFFVSTQVELMMAEVDASIGQDKATKVRPEDRIGPLTEMAGITEEELRSLGPEETSGYRVNIPGRQQKDASQDEAKLYLADYWWGMEESTAAGLIGYCTGALQAIGRYKALATDTLRDTMYSQEVSLELSLYRMGAAVLMSLDIASQTGNDPGKRELVEGLRNIFPGTPFKPTESFCRGLDTGHPDDPDQKEWHITCALGFFGQKNRTMLTVMDCSLNSPWRDKVLGNALLHGDGDENEYNYPTARQCYDVLLEAMAGAGSEVRCSVGPPRRPHVVVVSYRLRACFQQLKELLQRVNVNSILDTKDGLQFACANNQTDFETGGPPQQGGQTLVGQRVGICELLNRRELNGRVGRVVKFHEDKRRWEIRLERNAPGEKALTIAVKPTNVVNCPPRFENEMEYMRYREEVRSWSGDDGDSKTAKKTEDADVKAFLDKLRSQDKASEEYVCAICQDSATNVLSDNSTALLPCGHTFHLECLVPWIREKIECPVCRTKF